MAANFAYGENSKVIKEKRLAAIQAISGTGALRVAGQFFSRFLGNQKEIYIPNPTWGNHSSIMKDSGLTVKQYEYLNKEVYFSRW